MDTMRIHSAVQTAIQAHTGQVRKGKNTPYVVHPLLVGMLLAHIGASDNAIIAGILHDTLEDTTLTYANIAKEFGEQVAKIVAAETQLDKTLHSWEVRKTTARENIATFDSETLLVKTADLLHNASESLQDVLLTGKSTLSAKQLEHYILSATAIAARKKDNALLGALQKALQQVKKEGNFVFD